MNDWITIIFYFSTGNEGVNQQSFREAAQRTGRISCPHQVDLRITRIIGIFQKIVVLLREIDIRINC